MKLPPTGHVCGIAGEEGANYPRFANTRNPPGASAADTLLGTRIGARGARRDTPVSRSASAEVDALLDAAEAARACLALSGGPGFTGPLADPLVQRIRRRQRAGELVSPQRGLFARAAIWRSLDPCERDLWSMRALSSLHRDWVFCGFSAAEAHGLWAPWRPGGPLHVTRLDACPNTASHSAPASHSARRSDVAIAWRKRLAPSCVVVGAIRATPLDVTVVDCLCEMPFADALGIADSWLRGTGLTCGDLARRVERHGAGHRGVQQARQTASHADGRAENGGESFCRARMIELGYRTPRLQVEIPDPIEPWEVKRVDFLWDKRDGTRIVGELDGLVKYTDRVVMNGLDSERVRARERLRESRLAVPGVSVMRFSIGDARNDQLFRLLLDRYGVPREEG